MKRISVISLLLVILNISCENNKKQTEKISSEITIIDKNKNISENYSKLPLPPSFNNKEVEDFIKKVQEFHQNSLSASGDELLEIQSSQSENILNNLEKLKSQLPPEQAKKLEDWYNQVLETLLNASK